MKKLKEMKKSQIAVIASAILLVVVIVAVVLALTMCGNDSDNPSQQGGETQTTGSSDSGDNATYTVSVKTQGGMIIPEIEVYVYADNTLADLKNYAATDDNGIATFSLPKNDNYAVVLSGVPKGYNVESSYAFSNETAVITLSSSIITGEDVSGAKLGVGDVMYDLSVKTPDGVEYTLSELLKEKDMVLVNFWYTTCTYCVEEFPFMEEAYQQYKDDIEIVAINPMNGSAEIKTFQEQYGLSFPMGECSTAWPTAFDVQGYPTSVIVDRYGVICMIEAGGITSLRPFVNAFEHFTADDYQQKLCVNGIADLITNVKPTYTMDTSENIGAQINKGDIQVTYRPETDEDSAEYSWPFIIGDKNGEKVIYASNQKIDGSFAIIYADITLKEGQAIGFDYLSSTERTNDVLYVIVNGEDIYQISGVAENDKWQSCYPCVATEDGTYELALCYMKDDGTNEGDDTVYIKNMRAVDANEIDTPTYLPRLAATTKDGFEFEYVDVVYNEKDGYYHVGSANGPLLLADLMGFTQFNEESSIHDLTVDGDILLDDGRSIYEELVDYCSYATNTKFGTVCTVNKELAELLKKVAEVAGFDEEDENEWLKICTYYQAYGTENEQLDDPIKGLSPFSAYEAKLGVNVSTNYFYYDRAIIPRGLFAKFVPDKSGVYRITSRTDTDSSVDGWIFGPNKEELLVFEHNERLFEDMNNVSMVYYMEAGKDYYIDIAFWDLYETGYIYYDIEYIAPELEYFVTASPGFFTYDDGATGEEMYYVISGGIKAVLGSDGKYYEDLGKDASGNQLYGSLIYADFVGTTGIFSSSIESMIDKGGFDFSKTEEDAFVLSFLEKNNFDIEATDAELKEYWGDEYEAYAEIYLLEEVYAGRYHGTGEDLTAEMRTYLSSMDKSGNKEREGCVVVTERLAEILQLVMDKYTFENVDDSWLKLCYYYDYVGPKTNK